ncbi:uncharacterized protein LOC135097302 [Scylla paramamosain]|uniref:uncharacterized protein LOC135097302 n=1 Tax=Scylla paramamosain TaxID=85552 RepID=UPI003083AD7B
MNVLGEFGSAVRNVIVRQSSQLNSRALSVRLPPDKGPYIQHYLIEIHNEGSSYSLQASENRFDTLPSLITYYSQCCEELLAQLKLPRTIQEAKTRHELGSLSLLGQGTITMPKWKGFYDSQRNYKCEWERTFLWVKEAPDGRGDAYCKLFFCNLKPRLSIIQKHEQTEKHKMKQSVIRTTKPITVYPSGPSEDVKKTELELAVAISCHCSIKSIDHLGEIMKKTWKRKYTWENIIAPGKMQQIGH